MWSGLTSLHCRVRGRCARAVGRSRPRSLYDDPDIDQITSDDLAGAYPAVQYWPPDQNYSIDLISRLGSAFAYDDIEWHWIDVEGHRG